MVVVAVTAAAAVVAAVVIAAMADKTDRVRSVKDGVLHVLEFIA